MDGVGSKSSGGHQNTSSILGFGHQSKYSVVAHLSQHFVHDVHILYLAIVYLLSL